MSSFIGLLQRSLWLKGLRLISSARRATTSSRASAPPTRPPPLSRQEGRILLSRLYSPDEAATSIPCPAHFITNNDGRRTHRLGAPKWTKEAIARFLKARKFDTEMALQMWADMLRWRTQSLRILSLMNWMRCCATTLRATMASTEKVGLPSGLPWRRPRRSDYPQGYHGVDREGRTVYIERLGKEGRYDGHLLF